MRPSHDPCPSDRVPASQPTHLDPGGRPSRSRPASPRRRSVVAGLTLILASTSMAGHARAGQEYYTSRSTFDASNPGLPVENFGSGVVPVNSYVIFSGPLSSSTDNGVFSTGSILPGLTLEDNTSPTNSLVLGGSSLFSSYGYSSNLVGDVSSGAHTLDLLFSGANPAVGFDLANANGPGSLGTTTFTIDVFVNNASVASQVFNEPAAFTFFGVSTSSGSITEIQITPGENSPIVGNIAFGVASSSVPEPAGLTLFGSGLMILIAAWIVRCRGRRRAAGRLIPANPA
jgi:hypothetical protein